MESLTIPKDAYPLVIFDVSRRILVYSPRGRECVRKAVSTVEMCWGTDALLKLLIATGRRLICAKTEEDFQMVEQAIHRTGERISAVSSS